MASSKRKTGLNIPNKLMLTPAQLTLGLLASHRADMRRRLDDYPDAGFIDHYELDGRNGKIGVRLDDKWYEFALLVTDPEENT